MLNEGGGLSITLEAGGEEASAAARHARHQPEHQQRPAARQPPIPPLSSHIPQRQLSANPGRGRGWLAFCILGSRGDK